MQTELDEDLDDRILAAAEHELNTKGLTGMRVAEVAERAGTTLGTVYRRFFDRDGLVAAALTWYFRSRFRAVIEMTRSVLDTPGELSVDLLIGALPPMRYAGSETIRHRMHRVYVAASENLALRLSILEATRQLLPEFDEVLESIARRFPPGRRFDPRIFTIFVLRHNGIIDDVLGDDGTPNDEYRNFLRTLLLDSIEFAGGAPTTIEPMVTMPVTPSPPTTVIPIGAEVPVTAIDRRILIATQHEIDVHGLAGSRIARIAESAGTSVAMIYRRFGDRNGVISAALSATLDARMVQIAAMARPVLDLGRPISTDDIVEALPPLHYEGSEVVHARLQRIYIAALEIPALRESVKEILDRRLPECEAVVHEMIDRLPVDQRFDPRILTLFLLRYNFIIDDLLGEFGITNDEFRAFSRDLMIRSASRRRVVDTSVR